MQTEPRLKHFPISFFAMVMGLAGLTLAWQKAQQAFALAWQPGSFLLALSGAVFLLLLGVYVTKMGRFGGAVAAEFRHPVKLNFFPTISISLILLATASLHLEQALALPLWVSGSAMHLLFTLYVFNAWIHHEHFEIEHISPAWFIPVVGNVLVPIAGVPLGFGEVSWFFFSFGMLFWLVLLTIIFYRVMFHHPLPDKLVPTFFILIAPPAVGFIAYVQLTGDVDAFARILFYAALFLTLLLLAQTPRFLKLPFFLSWWAYSFPLAAITVASFVMAEHIAAPAFRFIAITLLTLLSIVVAYLIVRTVQAVRRHGICLPNG